MRPWVSRGCERVLASTVAPFRANLFSLDLPDEWTDASTVTLLARPRELFTPNVQINQEPVPEDQGLRAYFTSQRAELQAGLPGFRLLGHGDRTVAGQAALWHEYIWHNPERSVDVHQLQVGLHAGGTIYTVTASALERDWAEFAPEAEQVLASLSFT